MDTSDFSLQRPAELSLSIPIDAFIPKQTMAPFQTLLFMSEPRRTPVCAKWGHFFGPVIESKEPAAAASVCLVFGDSQSRF